MDKTTLSRHLPAMTPKTPHSPPNGSRIVEVLAFPSVQLLDVTGPIQVFASANNFMVSAGNAAPYVIRVVALAVKASRRPPVSRLRCSRFRPPMPMWTRW